MVSISVSIDVPNLGEGVRFYSEAFGFSQVAQPAPGVVVLKLGPTSICLLEKKSGTKPSPNTKDLRSYKRHWTPVHLDIHVPDLSAARARAVQAGMIENLLVASRDGVPVPLSSVARVHLGRGPAQITRDGQQRVAGLRRMHVRDPRREAAGG